MNLSPNRHPTAQQHYLDTKHPLHHPPYARMSQHIMEQTVVQEGLVGQILPMISRMKQQL